MVYGLTAFAQTSDENTISVNSQAVAYYQDVYVVAQYIPSLFIPKPSGPYVPVGNGECVDFIQAHGFDKFTGNAWEWRKYINSGIGWPGYAVLLDEGPYQHLALIIEIKEGYILVEQNYLGPYVISTRSISFDYNRILGFIKP